MNKKILVHAAFIILFVSVTDVSSQPADNNSSPTFFFVLIHSPGEKWVDSLSFNEQPGIMNHVNYMRGFFENKKLVLGGPFLDNSGGMMICNVETMEEAEKIANDDPEVKGGILNVKVKKWYVAMSNMTTNP